MAFKLPFREDFESWTTSQVADLFKQCGIQECIGVLEKLGLNGYTFLNMTTDELNKFNILYQPQLQRIVSDIKKNESGLFKKIKKFQNDQVALICKTGKDTWDRMKSKPTPPTVPKRDYQTGPPNGDDDEWGDDFGSDYDSPDEHSDTEQYVVPTEEADDSSYEPPPNDKHVTPSFKVMMANNGYADKQKTEPMNMHMRPPPKPHELFSRHQQPPPPVTNRLPTANKPLPKPRHPPTSMPPPVLRKPASIPPQPDCDDEENYIVPESESYIEPTKEPVKKPPAVNRQTKPMPQTPIRSPTMQPPETEDELYVVPENETTPSPPKRGLLPKVTSPSYLDQDEYEVCEDLPEIPFKPKPSPSPRNVPKPPTNFLQKPNMVPVLPQREINSNIDKPQVMQRQRIHSAGNEPPPVPPMPHKLPLPLHKPNVITIQKPPEVSTRYIPGPSRHGSTVEQDADVLNKEWYVSSCDRRKAEDALTATSKDGSFLVRKSSGQDSKQPFTLVVFYNRRVYNIPVRYIEATRQYALGREKSGEEKFHSVAEIIENHRQTPLVLIDSQNNTKDSTRLKQGVRIS
ncbi:B-cell linker protein isoform X2 [Bufo bufo]|uniref:B-cell linker protein isoform X2 n=1 Tax=Bufo bufo TaxID=8384 RepID=UPI001ABEC58B|nr:B-cell linker protein isoform X2 [Bufo bufo]